MKTIPLLGKFKIEQLKGRRETSLVLLMMLLLAIVTLRSPGFVSVENIQRIVNDTSILVMVSLGQFFVILAGGIDLSVGSMIGLSGMAASLLNEAYPALPALVILLAGVLIGTALGALNGFIVAIGKVPPIIVTLGTLSIFRGFTFVLSKGQWVTAHEMTESYMQLPHGNLLGISNLIWWGVIVSVLLYYLSNYTRSGREVYAIGGNKTAAKFVGVNERRINMMIFTLSGMVSGLAGVMWTARYAAAVNETATGFELQTVAACVIGGVSIAGGSGAVPGVILGALFIGVINNALPVINLSPFYQLFIQGSIVLFAMLVNTISSRRRANKLLQERLS
ncbi:MAG: ABC transporter permease [Spirochaetia bacterium]|jgi:rhamnose transport system permease protein|nr:ABC transporter permease [Spirochaetia bacterium]